MLMKRLEGGACPPEEVTACAAGHRQRVSHAGAHEQEPNGYPQVPSDLDNYMCSTLKLIQQFAQITGIELTDQFSDHRLYNLAKPYNLCVPASVEGSGVGDPGSYRLCYKVLRVDGRAAFGVIPFRQYRPCSGDRTRSRCPAGWPALAAQVYRIVRIDQAARAPYSPS